MALHGKIEINGDMIGEWQAVRQQHPPGKVNDYAVWVFYVEPDGTRHTRNATITHNFGDGALTLAAEVLAWAAKQLPPKSLTKSKKSATIKG